MDGDEFAVKAVAVAGAAIEHTSEIGTGREPDGNSFLRSPGLFDAMARQITFELLIHYIGRQQQSNFAQFGELMLSELAARFGATVA